MRVTLDARSLETGRRLEKMLSMSIDALAYEAHISGGTKRLRITVDVLETTAHKGFSVKRTPILCTVK